MKALVIKSICATLLITVLLLTACSLYNSKPSPTPLYTAQEAKYIVIEEAPNHVDYYYTNAYTAGNGMITIHGYWSVSTPLKGVQYTDGDITIGGQFRIESNK